MLFFSAGAVYLVWIVRDAKARLGTVIILFALVIYCWWFAELPFYALATAITHHETGRHR